MIGMEESPMTMKKNTSAVDYEPSRILSLFFEWVSAIVIAGVVVALLFSCVLRIVNVSGDSMKDTFQNGDRLILSNFMYEPHYGDVVVLTRENDTPLIKRVIGLAGDRIRIDAVKGVVYRNGEELEEPYVRGGYTPTNGMTKEVTVPEGTLFVMGDNRSESLDSRILGPQSLDHLVGRVLYRIAPNPGTVTNGE